jgi:Protein of unknown function (DUF2865)
VRSFAGRLVICAVGLVFALTGAAAAQSCYSMQVELMNLQARGFNPGDTARFEQAYREQANVIAQTQTRAQDAGCFGVGFFFFRRSPSPICDTLLPKLRQMQDNLARLDHLRRQAGPDDAYRMQELQGMMQARGCDLPGGNYQTHANDNWFFQQNPEFSGNGTYRTLCVRTCDGFYFPISFSTTSDRFPADAQTCQSMCPGAQATLYYYPNPGGGPETMVSMTGEPYSALPTAFQYRTSLNPACTCKSAGLSASAAPLSIAPSGPAVDLTAPLPTPRPAPGEDPETLADRAGDFVPHASAADSVTGTPVATSGNRSVRVVGPPLGNADQDALIVAPLPN